MLKFIKGHMASIGGIEIYPLISFIIFFVFFLLLLIYVIKVDKQFVSKMGELPLEKDDDNERWL
ncbi:MAG TPA: CcoQ/FixQ family Cbb3-type cytochrome c oxidase assembly chaperone [Cytophagaceae bacterium]